MSATAEMRPKPAIAAMTVALLSVSPLLYALSVGPAAWLASNNLIVDYDSVAFFYRPLFVVAQHFQPFANLLAWYIILWGGVV